jgi:hypothetical protein
MDVFLSGAWNMELRQQMGDPRLRATPDLGAFAQHPELTGAADNGSLVSKAPLLRLSRLLHVAATSAGIVAALLVSVSGGFGAAWEKFGISFSRHTNPAQLSHAFTDAELDRRKPQEQAEILLEQALSHSEQAPGLIEARVEGWRGKLRWDTQFGNLTTAALNSSDREVQNSAIDVQLAAYGLRKDQSSVDPLVRQANSRDHVRKIWAFWVLGLLANRGVESDRIVKVLTSHLRNSDSESLSNSEESRRWAVEALALVGTTSTITPLLDAMHDDPAATVRERAACTLAQSSMLSHEQRWIAVPRLIDYSADPALDPQTHILAFQALSDITGQRLPQDAALWREWYQSNSANN